MRISLARKNLLREKTRFAISLGGVAFSVMLILVLLGLYNGWNEKLTRYVEEVDADVWVLQKGAADMFHSTSLFANEAQEQLGSIDGVEQVTLLLGRQVTFDVNDQDAHVVVMGYDTSTGVGGPLEVIEGEETPNAGEIVVDEVFADAKGVGVGDTLDIHDHKYTIAGISTGGNLVSFQYAFMPIEEARRLLQMEDVTNYALIRFSDSADQERSIKEIEDNFPGLDVLAKSEFAANNREQITESFLPIIYVLVVIGFIVGLVVISLTIYTATIEKSREFGLLKAVGAPNAFLYHIILEQAFYAGVIGYVLGIGFTYAVSWIAQQVEPAFLTYFRWQDMALVFGIVFLMIVSASYIPIRRLVHIDPAIVFKA